MAKQKEVVDLDALKKQVAEACKVLGPAALTEFKKHTDELLVSRRADIHAHQSQEIERRETVFWASPEVLALKKEFADIVKEAAKLGKLEKVSIPLTLELTVSLDVGDLVNYLYDRTYTCDNLWNVHTASGKVVAPDVPGPVRKQLQRQLERMLDDDGPPCMDYVALFPKVQERVNELTKRLDRVGKQFNALADKADLDVDAENLS